MDISHAKASSEIASIGSEAPADVGQASALAPEHLYRPADLSALMFQSTADLKPIGGLVGQQRALDAIGVGTRIDKPGFNLFRKKLMVMPPSLDRPRSFSVCGA